MLVHDHPILATKYGLDGSHPLLTDDELRAISAAFAVAALVAEEAGFDFVDVKCAHGYLLHEALAARTRPGPYGGSYENRTRLLREIIDGIRAACPALPIGVRLSVIDLPPFEMDPVTHTGRVMPRHERAPEYGFGVTPGEGDRNVNAALEEPLRLVQDLAARGIDAINVTLGSPYYCPHAQRPATYPPSDGYLPPEHPLAGVARHVRLVRDLKARAAGTTLVGSGYTWLQDYLPHVAAHEVRAGHVDFVGLGRMVLAYPELPRDVIAGGPLDAKRLCRTFSDCTTAPRHGMVSGCYPLDEAYRNRPCAQQIRIIRRKIARPVTTPEGPDHSEGGANGDDT